MTSFDISEIRTYTGKVVIANQQQVKSGKKSNKAPAINWDKKPTDYTGLNDKNYPTALRTGYLPQINKHFIVFDLDDHGKPEDVPMEKLLELFKTLMEQTYSVKTPSGGYHIYLLTDNEPNGPKNILNIDYLHSREGTQGKYFIQGFRWDKKGENKEFYEKVPGSPEAVLVSDSDKILNDIRDKLTRLGYIKTSQDQLKTSISDLIKPFIDSKNVIRQEVAGGLSAYLFKESYGLDEVIQLFKQIFQNDEEKELRIEFARTTYQKYLEDPKKVSGFRTLQEQLPGATIKQLKALVEDDREDITNIIRRKLLKHRSPTPKELIDWLNTTQKLYKNPETYRLYRKLEDKHLFVEFDLSYLEELINKEFGANNISTEIIQKAMLSINQHVRKDYFKIAFKDGLLNTKNGEFIEWDHVEELILPRIDLTHLEYKTSDNFHELKKIIDTVLINDKTKELFYKAIGYSLQPSKHWEQMIMIQGEAGSGKSTILEILKRCLTYTDTKLPELAENEQFKLYHIRDTCISIDDDVSDAYIKNTSHLQSIISGKGITVYIKNVKDPLNLAMEQLPVIWSAGNTLPGFRGEGMDRRIILLKTNPRIEEESEDAGLAWDIPNGIYDHELGALIKHSLNLYLSLDGKKPVTRHEEGLMNIQRLFTTNPVLAGAELLFMEKWGDGNEYIIPNQKVNQILKEYLAWLYRNKKIEKKLAKTTTKKIANAMRKAGHDSKLVAVDYNERVKCYYDISLNLKNYKLLKGDKLSIEWLRNISNYSYPIEGKEEYNNEIKEYQQILRDNGG